MNNDYDNKLGFVMKFFGVDKITAVIILLGTVIIFGFAVGTIIWT